MSHISPQQALERLRTGNDRFTADAPNPVDIGHVRRLETARGQQPFATLVGCSDSRVGPELLFGSGLGELFIVRNAGNSVDTAALGSVHYSVAVLGVPLVVVLGHERCGAIEAALDVACHGTTLPPAIASLVDEIVPVVRPLIGSLDGADLVRAAVMANVRHVVAMLRQTDDPVMRDPLDARRLLVVGAYYDLQSGRVAFMDVEDDA